MEFQKLEALFRSPYSDEYGILGSTLGPLIVGNSRVGAQQTGTLTGSFALNFKAQIVFGRPCWQAAEISARGLCLDAATEILGSCTWQFANSM